MKHLDKNEKKLVEEIENGDWIPLAEKDENLLIKKINKKGKKHLKPSRINLRLNPMDIILAKEKAAIEGLPYQTVRYPYDTI